MKDYRVNEFETPLEKIPEKKQDFLVLFREKHPRTADVYRHVRENDGEYKRPFMKIYNDKCAYCGVSLSVLGGHYDYFEIDHFIHKKHPQFSSDAEAGSIENIVLACHDCNHRKLNYSIPDSIQELVFPDGESIKSVFTRDNEYTIVVTESFQDNKDILEFYNKLGLGMTGKQLDYAIMRLLKMQEQTDDPYKRDQLGKIIAVLVGKRSAL